MNKFEQFLEKIKEGKLDCGNHSCYFAIINKGMRTNGGCNCIPRSFSIKERIELIAQGKKTKIMQ